MINHSLTPVNKSIFTKIKNLFGQQRIEDNQIEEEEDAVDNQQEMKNSIFAQSIKVEETEERRLIRLQQLIREKRLSEHDLSMEEQQKLRKLYNSQIQDLKSSILQKRKKIKKIKYEQKRKAHAIGK